MFVSSAYWEERYRRGGHSGAGSYGRLARFKAEVINAFVADHRIGSVVEFGVGDGHQLSLARYPSYLGIDVSPTAIALCRESFAGDESKSFVLLADYRGETADMSLSLDVIFHLVEDDVFEAHMAALFDAARRFVIIYASNDGALNDMSRARHMRHRRFTDWIDAERPDWQLIDVIANRFPLDPENRRESSPADFHIYAAPDAR